MSTATQVMQDAILVTRPAFEAAETAQRLRILGWRPVLTPMLHIEPRGVRLPAGRRPSAVVVTSGNALPGLPATLRHELLLAVGGATAARARALGFVAVESADGDASALLRLVSARLRPEKGSLLLASGQGQGLRLLRELQERGYRVIRRVAYAAHPAGAIDAAALAAMREGSTRAALFFSSATAVAFGDAARRAGVADQVQQVAAVAISGSVARSLEPLPWRTISVASHPTQEAMLACL